MKEEEIRKKYQRDNENDLRGINIGAMDRFIEMLHIHEKSEDSCIRSIADNFEYIDKKASLCVTLKHIKFPKIQIC